MKVWGAAVILVEQRAEAMQWNVLLVLLRWHDGIDPSNRAKHKFFSRIGVRREVSATGGGRTCIYT